MWLCDTAVKRPHRVAAIALSLLHFVFGVGGFFDKIEFCSDLKENS
ncbi:hypothetical protein [Psychromonas sp.]